MLYEVITNDTAVFSREILAQSLYHTLQRLWHFLKSNIEYSLDPPGVQMIQTPAYTWFRKKGDCKSYTIFISVITSYSIHYTKLYEVFLSEYLLLHPCSVKYLYVLLTVCYKTVMLKKSGNFFDYSFLIQIDFFYYFYYAF